MRRDQLPPDAGLTTDIPGGQDQYSLSPVNVPASLASNTGPVQASVYKVSGVQVLIGQQTGLGTALSVYTLSGTYATDLTKLQTLYNKVLAMETIMRAHGFATT